MGVLVMVGVVEEEGEVEGVVAEEGEEAETEEEGGVKTA